MERNTYTAYFQREAEWWVGWIAEVPGVHTQERTLPEARESLREALQLILQCNREEALRCRLPGEVIEEEMILVPA
jgi:predicted RNase H-like HicB family nuclease